MSFSHRDRRTHRTVKRGLAWIAGTVGALTLLAVVLPGSWGILCVGALAVSGAAYLLWSGPVLSEYVSDLKAASNENSDRGFLRAEVAGIVGLERTVGRPTERSPNTRPRS
jgi:hypothetical protein